MADSRENKVQFWAGSVEPQLRARVTEGTSLGMVAKRDLERYYALLRASVPTFTPDEASLLVYVLRRAPDTSAHLLWAMVEDALQDKVAPRTGIDAPALVARLRGLAPCERIAIIDAAERYWASPEGGEEGLRAVGLIQASPVLARR